MLEQQIRSIDHINRVSGHRQLILAMPLMFSSVFFEIIHFLVLFVPLFSFILFIFAGIIQGFLHTCTSSLFIYIGAHMGIIPFTGTVYPNFKRKYPAKRKPGNGNFSMAFVFQKLISVHDILPPIFRTCMNKFFRRHSMSFVIMEHGRYSLFFQENDLASEHQLYCR